ncbi:hypothetical protein RHSIM_Rhsim02G0056500 [Rhododendron simsii]|uniref:Uncharacterized protein n=1 Tax=Rhododendron simsii TaxID=118357 RepID=A0A834LXB9_RHOSS|nr:hypothetical protein RHSIM_Rhsim02G0056500 [Rhododendron simsii]
MAAFHLPRLFSNHPFSDLTYRSRFLLRDPFDAMGLSNLLILSQPKSKPEREPEPEPRKLRQNGFLMSNPSTPSLRCRTTTAEAVLKSSGSDDLDSPKLERKTNITKFANSAAKSPKPLLGSNPSW